jgi:O-succinylbenzoic acid--CoA ligase
MTRAEFAALLGAPAGLVAEAGAAPAVIAESDPRKFMASFAEAVARGGEVFLTDPKWSETERSQLAALIDRQVSGLRSQVSAQPARGWLLIPTGGTSGALKFARHDEETLSAAVRGFTQHFGLSQVNAMGVLPLHHVSGLMAWLRCALTGGEFLPLDWKTVESGELPAVPAKPAGWVISLVPTQLERLLRDDRALAWLKSFRIIFLGGAPAWPALLDAAAAQQLPISLGYGMTETAAMITALRPAEFLAGIRTNGAVLPHASVAIGEADRILLNGTSLFRGYYPGWREAGPFATQDRGQLDASGHLHVLGRIDAVIITGGEKVEPGELEAVLRGTGQFPDVIVLGLPDSRWGQQVVAVYPGSAQPNFHAVILATNRLADYKRPKRFIPLIGAWPANAQGKVNRIELTERVIAQLKERR